MAEPAEFSDQWRLTKLREPEHVVAALVLAQTRWRDVLEVIAGSADPADARSRLSGAFGLDEIQSTAVVDAQNRRLTMSERQRTESELTDIRNQIADLEAAVEQDPEQAGVAIQPAADDPERRGWWGFEPRGTWRGDEPSPSRDTR